jgi:hypothetical protein
MPICTNPKCGEISKSATRFCPHCGQETLSNISKDQIGNPVEKTVSMESFFSETTNSTAPQDISSKPQRSFWARKKLNRKKFLSILFFALLFPVLVLGALPSSFQDALYQKTGFQKEFSIEFNEDQLQFKFIDFSDSGIPAYFSGCGSINYYVRQNYATEDDLSIISRAMSIIGGGAEREFVFKGVTSKVEVDELPENSILIDFTNSVESKDLRQAEKDTGGEVAGLGGMDKYHFVNKPRINSISASRGTVWINQKYWEGMGAADKTILIAHEVGHVLGLDHPLDGLNQLMDANDYSTPSLGSGDLMGLHILSAIAGCREFPTYLTGDSSAKSFSGNDELLIELNSAGNDTWIENSLETWQDWGAKKIYSSEECQIVVFQTQALAETMFSDWENVGLSEDYAWHLDDKIVLGPSADASCVVSSGKVLGTTFSS